MTLRRIKNLSRLCKFLGHLGKCFLGGFARLLGLLFKSPRMRDGALPSTLLRLPIEFFGATELRDQFRRAHICSTDCGTL